MENCYFWHFYQVPEKKNCKNFQGPYQQDFKKPFFWIAYGYPFDTYVSFFESIDFRVRP